MTSTVPFVSNGAANGNGSRNGNGYSKAISNNLKKPVSTRISERLRQEGISFLANDNVAEHIEPGELRELEVEVADKVRDLLRSLVIDIDNRLLKIYNSTLYGNRKISKKYNRLLVGCLDE